MYFWSLVCFFSSIIFLSFLSITSFSLWIIVLLNSWFLKFFCSKKHTQGICLVFLIFFFLFFLIIPFICLSSPFVTSSFVLSLSLSFYFLCFSICLTAIPFLLILIQLAQLCPLSRQYNVLYMNSPKISYLSKTDLSFWLAVWRLNIVFHVLLLLWRTRTWSWRCVNWEKNA